MDLKPIGRPRVAFFGGSFDPPHLGHLEVARAARSALDLDTVLFAPVGEQPLKPLGSTAPFAHRLAMTRLAIADDPTFAVSLADAPISSGAPNYSYETLLGLRAELPPEAALFCLMGADSFASLRHWHRAAEIPFVANLIVASRPSNSLCRLDDLTSLLPEGLMIEALADVSTSHPYPETIELRQYILRNPAGSQSAFYLLPSLDIEISASDIRGQVRVSGHAPAVSEGQVSHPAGLSASVSDYIRAHHLYC